MRATSSSTSVAPKKKQKNSPKLLHIRAPHRHQVEAPGAVDEPWKSFGKKTNLCAQASLFWNSATWAIWALHHRMKPCHKKHKRRSKQEEKEEEKLLHWKAECYIEAVTRKAQASTQRPRRSALTSARPPLSESSLRCVPLYSLLLKVMIIGHLSLISICHLLRSPLVRSLCLNWHKRKATFLS